MWIGATLWCVECSTTENTDVNQLVGKQLGRYTIQQELGHGGMAWVYLAIDTVLHRPVALKILSPQLGVDDVFVKRFQREATLAANLRHPGIVTVYDVGVEDHMRYIAMEYVEGRTLNDVLKERGGLDLSYVVSILEPLCQALDYAHSQGAIHRDIKPHNIMIGTDGRVLLTDFGIARQTSADAAEKLTRTGTFMGTPEYLSPEQIETYHIDGKSDLYSLGIVTYEIITGRVPFSGTTPRLILAHTQEPPPRPSLFMSGLSPDVDSLLARVLAKKPQDRFATCVAFWEALQLVVRRQGIAPASNAHIAALAVAKQPGEAHLGMGSMGTIDPEAATPIAPARPAPAARMPTQSTATPAHTPVQPPAAPLATAQPVTGTQQSQSQPTPQSDARVDQPEQPVQHSVEKPSMPTWVPVGVVAAILLLLLLLCRSCDMTTLLPPARPTAQPTQAPPQPQPTDVVPSLQPQPTDVVPSLQPQPTDVVPSPQPQPTETPMPPPPTEVPPTELPTVPLPTAAPPTVAPPTEVPPTSIPPPTAVPPTPYP